MSNTPLSWIGIVRLGLVQTALGACVVLATSTLNRVMVVELAWPAMVPGALVGLHHALQILRPRMGFGSDVGGRLTPWIVGGMGVLALGSLLAAVATAWMVSSPWNGLALAIVGFALIGVGVSAAGTSLLILLAKQVAPGRRPAAATIVWLMMIAGFAITGIVSGHFLDPFSPGRLVVVASCVAALALGVAIAAISGIEWPRNSSPVKGAEAANAGHPAFFQALAQVWGEPEARRFTIFVFVSMLAYSAQDLILEPFAGTIFAMTPGQSTKLGGILHSGVFVGMLMVAVLGSLAKGRWFGSLTKWAIGGCLTSALALIGLTTAGLVGPTWPLIANVFVLGISNGAFAIAAIASMMMLSHRGQGGREGVRMGLWGASQAIAFGLGGFAGSLASDLARALISQTAHAYAMVFALEALLFLAAAWLAAGIGRSLPSLEPQFQSIPMPARPLAS